MGAAEKRDDALQQLSRDDLLKLLIARQSPWYTLHQAAEYCQMSPAALQKAVERGRLAPDSPARRGRSKVHRFRRETLDRFLAEG